MNELRWMNWNECIDIIELKGMNWNEKMRWRNLNEWMTWMNWIEWIEMKELKWTTWNEWIDMNELTWNECIGKKELKWMHEMTKSAPNPAVVWDVYLKWSSFDSLGFILSISLPKSGLNAAFFLWNRALATVSCTFCRPLSSIDAHDRGNRDPPAATTDGHRVLRPRAFSSVNFQAFPIDPTAHRSQQFDDDVVDIETAGCENPWLFGSFPTKLLLNVVFFAHCIVLVV